MYEKRRIILDIRRNVELRLLIFGFFFRKDYFIIKGDSFIQFGGTSKMNPEKRIRNVWAYFVYLSRNVENYRIEILRNRLFEKTTLICNDFFQS